MARELKNMLIDDEGNLVLPLAEASGEDHKSYSITIKFLADTIEASVFGDSGEVLLRKRLPKPQPGNSEHDYLLHAARSGCDFWDNPVDDEIWNDA